MMQRVFTGAPWEKKVGYCRAVRAGSHVYVSGTAPVAPDGTTFAPGDAYAQAKRCFEIATAALRELGAGPEHVVRTRMYVTDIARWNEYGRAHRSRGRCRHPLMRPSPRLSGEMLSEGSFLGGRLVARMGR